MAKHLRLGLDTYSYHFAAAIWPPSPPEPLTLEGYLDRAADLAVDGLALADMGHFESTDPEAVRRLTALARDRGLLVGISSGANVWAARQLARSVRGNIATVLPDRAERYFSTALL